MNPQTVRNAISRRPYWPVPVIAAAFLFGALGHWPYGYYMLLRSVTCAAAVFFIWWAHGVKRTWAIWPFALVALLFNPIAPVHLSRDAWQVIDVAVAVLFHASGVAVPEKDRDAGGWAATY